MSSIRKRKNVTPSASGRGRSFFNKCNETISKSLRVDGETKFYPPWLTFASFIVGVVAMLYCGYLHSQYMYTIHENNLWFTNLKEVEREISFRTESGLYYSYYKQMVQAPSLSQGLQELLNDRLTEYPDTINILERMNIYQEVMLAAFYRLRTNSVKVVQDLPILFYIRSVFALHGALVAALFVLTWLLSSSWLAGVLACTLYMVNRLDTTRVEYTVPLRESFALPFLWMQAASMTYYFRPTATGSRQRLSVLVMFVSTFLFCLFWQFNQFIMLLQAFSLFGVWILDVLPADKVKIAFKVQVASLLAVCVLQFVNKMILGSLVLSFIPATWFLMAYRGSDRTSCHWLLHAGKVVLYSVAVLVLMILINLIIKLALNVEADEHIFKFLQNKFSGEETRDFDSRLYLCLSIFGFLTLDVYQRLTAGFVLPLYTIAHFGLLLILCIDVWRRWRSSSGELSTCNKLNLAAVNGNAVHQNTFAASPPSILLHKRPELVFHTVQCVFFGALAMTTLRMKYLWTPYMCVLAAVAVGDQQMWRALLSFKSCGIKTADLCRHIVLAVVLAAVLALALPNIYQELEQLREFWDPDTVELMEWIQQKTAPMASFTGSMQLMAGVKLCTGRPINNHPHYEDKNLRHKTKQLYQVYGRRQPEDVHAILTELGSNYIILEDSICLAAVKDNCRTGDLIDIDNGIIPDGSDPIPGLSYSSVPRFCDHVRNQDPRYTKLFKRVFENKTFRIYKVL